MSRKPSAAGPSLPSRREFIKTSSILAASGVLASNLGIARSAHAAGDDTIRIGLVGCGGRGTGAANQALSTPGKTKLVAVADAFADNVEKSLQNLKKVSSIADKIDVPPERRFAGFDAYQKVIDSGVDLVILATPPGFRPIHFNAAVEAGKHVFMEKPVAVDGPGVRSVLASAEEAKKKSLAVGVGLQRHHQKGYLETMKRLHDGAIGDFIAMRAYWNGAGVWVRQRMPEQTEMEYQMRNWYYFNWLCGDHICEQHIHNLDVINWLKGSYPVKANGMGGRQVRTGKEYGEIFDHHAVEYEYDDGSRMFSQCRHIPGCWASISEHVHGSKGSAEINEYEIRVKGEEPWRYRSRGDANPYQQEHDDLFAAIRSGSPYSEAENGALSTLTSILGRMATYSGKVVTWEEALNSNISLAPQEYSFKATPPVVPGPDGYYAIAVPGQSRVV
ncbi:MAG: Gfo/Idh/MocA family oxidoreductase [Planctomycetes bacterium]|nr:Gfo/Idh/MocA family oxidoreductase [Planctomycetota bacterium]